MPGQHDRHALAADPAAAPFADVPLPLSATLVDMRLPLEDGVFNEVLKDNRLKAVPIHANAAGYRVVAERLAEFLRETGAL